MDTQNLELRTVVYASLASRNSKKNQDTDIEGDTISSSKAKSFADMSEGDEHCLLGHNVEY